MNIKVGPSILASDFTNLEVELRRAKEAGADFLHVDVMDGHFVPNITIGPGVVGALRQKTDLPIHAHLMIENPERYFEAFVRAGSDIISFHIEAIRAEGVARIEHAKKLIRQIADLKKRPAIAINPPTEIFGLEEIFKSLDWVLIMSVNPGFGGQKFIGSVLPKITALRRRFKFNGDLEVDGGINQETAKQVVEAGANSLAVGTYLFKAKDMKERIRGLKDVS